MCNLVKPTAVGVRHPDRNTERLSLSGSLHSQEPPAPEVTTLLTPVTGEQFCLSLTLFIHDVRVVLSVL